MKINWNPSITASSLHAAACIQEGLTGVDPELAASIAPSVANFAEQARACSLEPTRACALLTALAEAYEDPTLLAEVTLKRLLGSHSMTTMLVSQWSAQIAEFISSFQNKYAVRAQELQSRIRPLAEQWETRGAGLMRQVAKLSDARFIPSSANVILVQPFVGGHGRAEATLNCVTFEALLTNPHPDFPEVVRLGWLLSQLNSDLPPYADVLSGSRRALITGLSTIPLVLQAAEYVEWIEFSASTMEKALACWHLPKDLPEKCSETLMAWWETYAAGKTSWHVALAGLDSMLPR